jgi:hypothetical protein
MKKISPYKRGVISLEGNNLAVFYHLSTSEFWSDKKGNLCRGLLY